MRPPLTPRRRSRLQPRELRPPARYFPVEELGRVEQTLFAFAARNAGPARVSRLRAEAVAAKRIGCAHRMTVDQLRRKGRRP